MAEDLRRHVIVAETLEVPIRNQKDMDNDVLQNNTLKACGVFKMTFEPT